MAELTGLEIKTIRGMTGLTQREFAEKMKVSYSLLSKVEVDQKKPRPVFYELVRLIFPEEYKKLMDSKK